MNATIEKNPVFWLMWLLPGATVLAGLTTLAIALQDADRALPEAYHWEGARLDADFERARQAARLGLLGELAITEGECRVILHGSDAPSLSLSLANGNDAHLDRALTLARGADGVYHAACWPLEQGKWRVALQDAASTWSIRTRADAGQLIELRARMPEGPGA